MRVVATLTTRPSYHKGLKENLDCLLNQFDDVYLGLPKFSSKGIEYPEFSYKNVKVVHLEEDLGPSCKLLGALLSEERDKNTLIVSVDDDYKYNENLRIFFEKEREKDLKKGSDRVIAQAGIYIKYWNFGFLGLNGGWHDNRNYFFDPNEYQQLTTIAGYAGVAYPANIFPDTNNYIDFIKKYNKDKILFRNDDVLISAYISNLGIKKYRISNTIKNLGSNNKEAGVGAISPRITELFGACHKLKDIFQKNNPQKVFSPVILEGIIIGIIIISCLLIFLRRKISIKSKIIKLFLFCVLITFLSLLGFLIYKDNKIRNFEIKDNTNIGNKIVEKIDHKFFSIFPRISAWNPTSTQWKNKPEKYSKFWKLKNLDIQKILQDQEIKPDNSYKNKAVIHFRCSDVPFCKHPQYHLYPKEYFYFVVEKIEKLNVDEILFLNCADWHNNTTSVKDPEKLCNNYINVIADWIQEKTNIKVNRNKICVSNKETYSIMLGCKVLISTGGSYSFIPGITKGKNYISPSNIGGVDKEFLEIWKNLHKKVHWTMWDKFDKISHKNLDYNKFDYRNYSNIKHVSKN